MKLLTFRELCFFRYTLASSDESFDISLIVQRSGDLARGPRADNEDSQFTLVSLLLERSYPFVYLTYLGRNIHHPRPRIYILYYPNSNTALLIYLLTDVYEL